MSLSASAWSRRASRLARCAEFRRQEGRCIIGGHHVVSEYLGAVGGRRGPVTVAVGGTYRRRHADLVANRPPHCRVVDLSEHHLRTITREPAPEGVLAEVPLPVAATTPALAGRVVVLYNVGLASNVGAVVRSAVAFGWDVVLAGQCADPFGYEAIRVSRGAALYGAIRVLPDTAGTAGTTASSSLADYLREARLTPVLASPHPSSPAGGCIAADEMIKTDTLPERIALILGNETRGLMGLPHMEGAVAARIGTRQVESLNVAVAGGILMHVLRT